ncbi:MAG: carbohydrate transporter permease [Paenibacillus sp.]|nr:carbohydrate transporter permease [Paenibacillus sp.]
MGANPAFFAARGQVPLPGALSVWNMILLMTFFRNVPKDLEKAALIDGANHAQALWSIYLPISLPAIATLGGEWTKVDWLQNIREKGSQDMRRHACEPLFITIDFSRQYRYHQHVACRQTGGVRKLGAVFIDAGASAVHGTMGRLGVRGCRR